MPKKFSIMFKINYSGVSVGFFFNQLKYNRFKKQKLPEAFSV